MYTYHKLPLIYSILMIILPLITSGCTSQSLIENTRLNEDSPEQAFSEQPLSHTSDEQISDDIYLVLSFSGGGTRAAAFSYGILEALRDTNYDDTDPQNNLLSEVDLISSVSGGSFTAAYYGLFGDQIFVDYEQKFLKQNIQSTLLRSLFNPINWFKFVVTGFNRTEVAVNYYDNYIFNGKTFADFKHDMPAIRINATDLSGGQPFVFRQEYFDLLCSDLSQFRVSRAVTASSAVPIAFAPIVLRNYHDCNATQFFENLIKHNRSTSNVRLKLTLNALHRYIDKGQIDFVHLVDGGIADNLGIRALYDTVNIAGGVEEIAEKRATKPPKYLILMIVNAAVSPENDMDKNSREPPILAQVNAVSSAQINRFSVESIELLRENIHLWAQQLSKTAGYEVKPFFIQIDFNGIQDERRNRLLNMVSTSLSLPEQQVNDLRSAAKTLLENSPEFQRLLREIHRE